MSDMQANAPMKSTFNDSTSDVMRQIQNLDSNLSRYRETITLLHDRIGLVLAPDPDTDTSNNATPTVPNKSNLASMLNDLNERLYYCNLHLDSIIQRVDL